MKGCHALGPILAALLMIACEQAAPPTEPYDPRPPAAEPSAPPEKPKPEAPVSPAAPPAEPSAPVTPIAFIPSSVEYVGKVGKPFRVQLPAATGGKSPIKYAPVTLGDGLQYNAQTRTVSGTPEKWRRYLVWLRATDSSPIPRRASLAVYINIDSRCPLFPKYASVQWTGQQGKGFRKTLPASTKPGLTYRWAWQGAIVQGYDVQADATLGLAYANGIVSGTPDKFGIVSGLYEGRDGDGCLQYSLGVSIRIDPPSREPERRITVTATLRVPNRERITFPRYEDPRGYFDATWSPRTMPDWLPASFTRAPSFYTPTFTLRNGSFRGYRCSPSLVGRSLSGPGSPGVTLKGSCPGGYSFIGNSRLDPAQITINTAWSKYFLAKRITLRWTCTPDGCTQA